jgi:HEPN domain-containing protein
LDGGALMRNLDLAHDYIKRANVRLEALAVLHDGESWADVVRESQEVVELALKALLRARGVDVPRVHDVAPILHAERARLPGALAPFIGELADASRQLRRDRELAFYGAEDLTPGEFYTRADADRALGYARRVVELVSHHVPDTT